MKSVDGNRFVDFHNGTTKHSYIKKIVSIKYGEYLFYKCHKACNMK